MSDQRGTHYAGCWRDHLDCASEEIADLRRQLDETHAETKRLLILLDEQTPKEALISANETIVTLREALIIARIWMTTEQTIASQDGDGLKVSTIENDIRAIDQALATLEEKPTC